ncbi:dehydrogenase [Cenarchaeum symbiosum A]|uniref:Dehydrogenase n=1 Tax=Cenarchaeum symbiosum (strain A) TaxID=414004 RepID=A0RUD6_CENSY|nr:dehydrogenase [Cenarchaeum symbiosum A]
MRHCTATATIIPAQVAAYAMTKRFDVVIVGAGILGTSIAYFLGHLNPSREIAVVEQALRVAFHTSGRNTGKVHAPYLYDPKKKALTARASFHGYAMWEEYSKNRGLPFKRDGVVEVAMDADATGVLDRHLQWGMENGLGEDEIMLLDRAEMEKREPNVKCEAAIYCGRDASVDYAAFTRALGGDTTAAGVRFLLNTRATGISRIDDGWNVTLDGEHEVEAGLLINAAGGEAVDLAHAAGVAKDLTDVHFRGEYWRAPAEYSGLTHSSVYSVPARPEYPFLDPHWIVRSDGTCEVGPNAVPVFSPYGYTGRENARRLVPKMFEMLSSGARKMVFDRQFQKLALGEVRSSLSKSAMIGRVQSFLPGIDPGRFTERGSAGIRSSVVDSGGHFVPDAVLAPGHSSFHILNYNSPGATGALPFAAHIVGRLGAEGLLKNEMEDAQCGPWRFGEVAAHMAG